MAKQKIDYPLQARLDEIQMIRRFLNKCSRNIKNGNGIDGYDEEILCKLYKIVY